MSSRSLNKVLLIGNLTVDPELRYTPQGTAVATFSIATNRNWTDQAGQPQEAVEFTRCVAWAKLAEVCSQILKKGKKVYVEGRLQTREWEAQDKTKRRTTEVIIESMIALSPAGAPASAGTVSASAAVPPKQSKKKEVKSVTEDEAVAAEDIPF
jgi:single-strand DNA-binding protein